jgi:Golgi SNAP receptor complex protein 2
MESLYSKTKGSLSKVSEDLTRLEKTSTADETKTVTIELGRQFEEILIGLDKLDIYVSKEVVNRRADTKLRVDQLKYDFRHLQAAFKSLQYKK